MLASAGGKLRSHSGRGGVGTNNTNHRTPDNITALDFTAVVRTVDASETLVKHGADVTVGWPQWLRLLALCGENLSDKVDRFSCRCWDRRQCEGSERLHASVVSLRGSTDALTALLKGGGDKRCMYVER